ncbi:hypothetical protein QMA10_16880 [Arthrobacter sp. APC 3897]|nr:hypothetical protein [Arthrobacter sp. APC 3897]MDN3483588.1 hypothetical protein [Arthrobacter sp. APC 3897]
MRDDYPLAVHRIDLPVLGGGIRQHLAAVVFGHLLATVSGVAE